MGQKCQLVQLLFLCTPHPLFSVVNRRGQCHFIYMLDHGWICLSLSETMICPSLENTDCAQTARKWEHEFSNNSASLLRAAQGWAESLSPPVITHKTAGRAKKQTKKTPACQHSFHCNCSQHIHRITSLIQLYNHCSLSPLIVSLLNLFVCLLTLATQLFFCHANQAISVLNLIQFKQTTEEAQKRMKELWGTCRRGKQDSKVCNVKLRPF